MDNEALVRVEQQRVDLEANIAKLKKSLRHWQTLEIDYESLQEEFGIINEQASPEECVAAVKDAGLELIDEKELEELLFDNNSRPRKPPQVINLLSKRVEYVARNVETIRKQISGEEQKRNALLVAKEPQHSDEAGLPLAEITEELDAAGKVIASKVENPGTGTNDLVDALKKAGVESIDVIDGTITKAAENSLEIVKSAEEIPEQASMKALTKIVIGKDAKNDDSVYEESSTNPNDTPAEAQLRQDMLNYTRGLDEVDTIVAELEMEEDGSDVSYDEDDLDLDLRSDQDEYLEDEDSEDETGKSKTTLNLSRGYQKKMLALQDKLGLKNVGRAADTIKAVEQMRRPPAAEAARKATLARHKDDQTVMMEEDAALVAEMLNATPQSAKKKVAFSSELDIAPAQPPNAAATSIVLHRNDTLEAAERPVKEAIIEREVEVIEAPASAPSTTAPKQQSRFKATRQAQPQTPMFAPPMTLPEQPPVSASAKTRDSSQIVSSTLVERPASRKTPKAPDPYDFSDESHRREIALEYEQQRMKRILAQDGGFIGNGENGEITPLEDENGRRISRFKAARILR
jgi:unconventional prefoldin RPB5 interactor 1